MGIGKCECAGLFDPATQCRSYKSFVPVIFLVSYAVIVLMIIFVPTMIKRCCKGMKTVSAKSRDDYAPLIASTSEIITNYLTNYITNITEGKVYTTRIVKFEDMKFVSRISSGGNAVVFKGTWKGTSVAIKKLNLQISDEEFLREVNLLA